MKLINHDLQILYPTLLLFCICIYNLTAEYANYHGFSVKVRGSRDEGGGMQYFITESFQLVSIMQCSPLMIPLCQLLFESFLFANLNVFREGRFWNWFPKSRFANLFICTFRSDEAIVSRSPQKHIQLTPLPNYKSVFN